VTKTLSVETDAESSSSLAVSQSVLTEESSGGSSD